MHFTGDEFLSHAFPETEFLMWPLLPSEGIVLLHAKWGSGKSYFGLNAANALQEGREFLGMRPKQVSTLYVEADAPPTTIQKFWLDEGFKPRMNLCFTGPFNCLSKEFKISPVYKELVECRETYKPRVVFINTLRKVYQAHEETSHHSVMVYSAFQAIFPGCLIVFHHHNRKESGQMGGNGEEDFAGFQSWADNANVVIALKRSKNAKTVTLTLTKSHAVDSEQVEPIKTAIGDGMTVVLAEQHGDLVRGFASRVRTGEATQGQAARELAEVLKCSLRHAERLISRQK